MKTCPKCGSNDLYQKFVEKGTEGYPSYLEKIHYEYDGIRYGNSCYKAKEDYMFYVCRKCGYEFTEVVKDGKDV